MATQKKRPSSENVKGMLFEGDFGAKKDEALPITDPLTTTQLTLQLTELKTCDRNPRKERNPEYEEIKKSIRETKKLKTKFTVTRRPGDDLYMIDAGGNTRLLILNELYEETGDEVFNQIVCLFEPWVSESSIITGHLIENVMRGDMMLIDKAHAVHELRKEIEEELGETLSDREFSKTSSERGYRISPKHLRRFHYALELDQMIPTVLRRGMGGSNLDKIKKIHSAYAKYCADKTDQFELVFADVMSRHDNEDFSMDEVRHDLDDQLEEVIGERYNIIHLTVQGILINPPPIPLNELDDEDLYLEQENVESNTTKTQPNVSQERNSVDTKQSVDEHHHHENSSELLEPSASKTGKKKRATIQTDRIEQSDRSSNAEAISDNEWVEDSDEVENDFNALQDLSYSLAISIATPYELGYTVQRSSQGQGYIMECPDEPFNPTQGGKNLAQYLAWWFLVSVSEQHTLTDICVEAWEHTRLSKSTY
jgi:ParB family protein of integrating conjugative element (PFGI_1 class)